MVFWQSIQASTNVADFQAYLRQFPEGTFAALARNRIAALLPTPVDLEIVPSDTQINFTRLRQGDYDIGAASWGADFDDAIPSHWGPADALRDDQGGCICQAERAPGSKVTRPSVTLDGSGAWTIGSTRTASVKYCSGPFCIGLDPLRLISISQCLRFQVTLFRFFE